VLGRVIAGRMSEVVGQQVIVENIGGAGGMTGSERVAKAGPDGYQFVLGTVGTHAQGEFVSYAKANQAHMQFGSAGAGSATHLGCVLLNYRIGIDVTHVPYRGTGPAMQDLEGGRIDYLCEIITTAKPQIDGGTVKGLAILDSKRVRQLCRICRPRLSRAPIT